jgi:hypothetical protein
MDGKTRRSQLTAMTGAVITDLAITALPRDLMLPVERVLMGKETRRRFRPLV